MNFTFIQNLFSGQAATAICWTLIHSIWEGMFFALVTGLIILCTKKSQPSFRYTILAIQFILFIIVIAGTFAWEWYSISSVEAFRSGVAVSNLSAAASDQQVVFANSPKLLENTLTFISNKTSILLALWFIIFLVKSIRVFASLAYLHRLRQYKSHEPEPYWKARIAELSARLKLSTAVQLLESELIKVPAVLGHLKPVIFIPLGILANLPAQQVEAILLHELAHIRRRDYLFNLVQNMAETIFFFNPALLWLSALIREEREHCCDDIAIAETKDRKHFIETLIKFREIYAGDHLAYVTAFPGTRNSFVNRITRIAMKKNKSLHPAENIFLAVSLVVTGALIMAFSRPKEPAPLRSAFRDETTVNARPLSPPVNAAASEIIAAPAQKDTLPKNKKGNGQEQSDSDDYTVIYSDIDKSAGRETVVLKTEGNEYKLVKLNGKIAYLVVNDEKIPKEKMGDYEEIMKKINNQLERMRKEQLIRDEEQKIRDKEQEVRNREQEQRNAEQANRDKEQEQRDAEQEVRNKEQHEREGALNKEQDERNAEQVIRNKEQEQRNAEQAIRNKEQEQRNAEQVIRNKEQEIRNEEMKKMTDDLISDGIIKNKKDLHSVSFMEDEFVVNGSKQPAAIFKKYKAKYPKLIGSRMTHRYD